MSKRKSTDSGGSEENFFGDFPADPLIKVPKPFESVVDDGGFTVLDFFYVLSEMKRLLKVNLSFTGPAEGTIELENCATRLWLSDRARKKTSYAGLCTELRFRLDRMSNHDERLQFVQDLLHWPTLDDDDAVTTERLLQTRFLHPSMALSDEKKRWLLQQPMPLCLRANYPYYTWPRWMFGIFEGLVVQRIVKKRAVSPKIGK